MNKGERRLLNKIKSIHFETDPVSEWYDLSLLLKTEECNKNLEKLVKLGYVEILNYNEKNRLFGSGENIYGRLTEFGVLGLATSADKVNKGGAWEKFSFIITIIWILSIVFRLVVGSLENKSSNESYEFEPFNIEMNDSFLNDTSRSHEEKIDYLREKYRNALNSY